MSNLDDPQTPAPLGIAKAATGIQGLDEIVGGGLPRGRPTLVCGGAGCGKTLLAMEFLIRGATRFGEPGVFMAFEETAEELAQNVASLGFDLDELVRTKKIVVDFVRLERGEIEETGEYDLEGLFVRLNYAIDSIGAKRVAIDTIETIFSGLSNAAILRGELRRLFRWLKDKGVTAVITGERGEGRLTRHGLEEYVSDCVILLDHRVTDQMSTRRLRIVKYRGTTHGTNEYPFLIGEDGISVFPVTSLGLQHEVSSERISSGISGLDAMLGGEGYFRSSTVLVSGTAGAGKTSTAIHFAEATCKRGERCLYFAFEESPGQLLRNMRSIGIDLKPWIDKGLLKIHASRAGIHGLEAHLATIYRMVQEYRPRVVVMDPITSMAVLGTNKEANVMLIRLIDFLKMQEITALLTSLTGGEQTLEQTNVEVSSLVDTWLFVRDLELDGERNRVMYVLKSRGTAHSNQLREFLLTNHGVELQNVYLGAEGVLTGSARRTREAAEQAATVLRHQGVDAKLRGRERMREALDARIVALRKEFEADEELAKRSIDEERGREEAHKQDRDRMAVSRQAGNGQKSAADLLSAKVRR